MILIRALLEEGVEELRYRRHGGWGVAEEKPVEKVGGKVGERWTGRGRESWGEEEEGEGGEGE